MKIIRFLLFIFAFVLFSCSKKDSVSDENLGKFNTEQNIIFLIDCSLSMQSIDFEPNRQMAVVNKLRDEIKQTTENQKIGIFSFSQNANLVCPLTNDKKTLDSALKSTTKEWLKLRPGTNFSDAISNATLLLKGKNGKKYIFIFSDGNIANLDQDLHNSLQTAIQDSITIHTISVNPKDFAMTPKTIDAHGNLIFEKTPSKKPDILFNSISKTTLGTFQWFSSENEIKNFSLQALLK